MAGLLGLALVVLVAAAVYGISGVIYERWYLPRAGTRNSLSSLENTLVYSLIPWVFFGAVVPP